MEPERSTTFKSFEKTEHSYSSGGGKTRQGIGISGTVPLTVSELVKAGVMTSAEALEWLALVEGADL